MQTVTGGGFGGKEEYPSMIAGHAALLARKSGRPVKMIYDRARGHRRDDQAPSRASCATAPASRATDAWSPQDIDVVMDGGAYVTLSPVVLSRGALHAAGPYAAATCACARASWRRTRRPTARSAASARRRRCSRSSCR